MVFSSVPVYLDPPNWQQPSNHHQPGSTACTTENPQQLPPVPFPPPAATGSSGSIRPGSMADRARMAKLPQPEAALKCPRCESTNTKFCYFNNYSLSQPRHFCKTCRRYWTRGGALRNVPVGGGCRRNKRSKGSSGTSSKSPVSTAERQAAGSSSSTSSSIPSSSCCTTTTTSDHHHMFIGHMTHQPPPPPHLPFMASLHHLTDHFGAAHDMGLNFSGIHQTGSSTGRTTTHDDLDFQMGISNSSGGGTGVEQWRLQQVQQFPFLAGLEPPPGLYPFEGEGHVEPTTGYAAGIVSQVIRAKPSSSSVAPMHGNLQGPVKMEENQGLNLAARPFLGIPGNDQYLGGNAWTDLSGFTSSSTSHLL